MSLPIGQHSLEIEPVQLLEWKVLGVLNSDDQLSSRFQHALHVPQAVLQILKVTHAKGNGDGIKSVVRVEQVFTIAQFQDNLLVQAFFCTFRGPLRACLRQYLRR